MKQTFKQDKGVAGLTIMLSLIVMLFIIGLLVMIFSLMGSEMNKSIYDSTTSTVDNETITTLNDSVGDYLSKYSLRSATCSIVYITNSTSGVPVTSGNYTLTACLLKGVLGTTYINQSVNVSYSYTYDADNTATNVMNDTTNSIAGTTEWFDIFIVIGAMVVLIFLTVIIITAIRSSGMVAGAGTQQGASQVGTA
jgi:uncharacterized membrane protein